MECKVTPLEAAGYAETERPLKERRRRVRAKLTPRSAAAFKGHVAALQEIVATAEPEHTYA